jgi:hypothetical protein
MVSFLRFTPLKGMQDNCIPLKIKTTGVPFHQVWQITGTRLHSPQTLTIY